MAMKRTLIALGPLANSGITLLAKTPFSNKLLHLQRPFFLDRFIFCLRYTCLYYHHYFCCIQFTNFVTDKSKMFVTLFKSAGWFFHEAVVHSPLEIKIIIIEYRTLMNRFKPSCWIRQA